jgi:hypothetical protein
MRALSTVVSTWRAGVFHPFCHGVASGMIGGSSPRAIMACRQRSSALL